MVIMNKKQVRASLSSLYTGKACVYGYSYTTAENGAEKKSQELLHEDIPCRLSYDRKVANDQDSVGDIVQDITMHCDPEYDIPAGSKIVITQNGRTRTYECSSQAAVYESHQEVELTAYRRRA